MAIGASVGCGPRSEINVTPLVDVVLVLLIIFMVVTPLIQLGYGMSLPPRQGPAPPPPDSSPIVVTLTVERQVYLNRDPVPLDQLGVRLRPLLAGGGPRVVFFSAADRVGYGDAVTVLDLIHSSGAGRIAMMEEYLDPRTGVVEPAR